jgi:hypothetical protein
VTFTMMIVSRWIFAKFGWGMAALITPTVLLLTGERALSAGLSGAEARPFDAQQQTALRSVYVPQRAAQRRSLASALPTHSHPSPAFFPAPPPPLPQAWCSSRWCCSAGL